MGAVFFNRYFLPIKPSLYTPTASSTSTYSHSAQSLPIPLPAILEPPEISTAIDTAVANLVSQLTAPTSSSPGSAGSRAEIGVQFLDRKRRKIGITGGWLGRLGGGGQTEEEVCWEEWTIEVVVARPRSEAGGFSSLQKWIVTLIIGRSHQGSTCNGIFFAEDAQDCVHCQSRQRSHTTNHD